ncbi:MAG: hypothetical protein HYS62_03510 [Candidatus Aenigmarchaeota archaeon]|nr:hypothetical protein [Candidatus Aenigmarchaeota archaeon]
MSLTASSVGQPRVVKQLTSLLTPKALEQEFDFIAGNANSGMIYGWVLRDEAERLSGREVPYVYVREEQKKGGQQERITGNSNNPSINQGDRVLIVESEDDPDIFLTKVNSSVEALREAGYQPNQVATILQPSSEVVRRLQELGLMLSYSVKPDDLKDIIASGGIRRTLQTQQIPYELGNPMEIAPRIIEAGALEIRDIDGGEKPFLYSSGNWGPGYLMIKGLVGQPHLMKYLCAQVALRVPKDRVDFVVGNVTGGLIPGWEIRNNLEMQKGEEVPFVYVEGSRVSEGRMIGEEDNHLVRKGDKSLVVEELVNFLQTTTNSVLLSRHRGYDAKLAATILHYKNPIALKQLGEHGLELFYVVSLPDIIDAAERSPMFKPRAVADYRRFLENPLKWQADRGYEPVREGGTR